MESAPGSLRKCLALCLLLGCGSGDDDEGKPEPAPETSQEPAKTDGDKPEPPAGDTGKSDSTAEGDDTYKTYPDPRGACKINSGYPDDHACILPPDPKEGFQIHVGPKNYEDREEVAKFILKAGEEVSACWTFHTPNDKDIYYQTSVLSGRSGTHHIINTMYSNDLPDGGFTRCADGGTGSSTTNIGPLPGASKPYMARGHVAPENKHIGRKIPARVTAQADMHYYNFTDHDIVREFWLNIYYVDESQITGEGQQIRGMGGFDWNNNPIPPGTNKVYSYECPIKGDGRILNLLGHYHAHGKRFTATIKRGGTGEPEKVFEMYDYTEPATFEYDSRTMNPEFTDSTAGAVSGMLEVRNGDVLGWECHIINDSDVGLRYVNEVKTGEMCNLWGVSYGIEPFNCLKR